MKLQRTKLGFTLIELLVVITIIGILATGATGLYTSQIQKARDSTRITSLEALRWALEQFYNDAYEYPEGWDFGEEWDINGSTVAWIKSYLPKLPVDPKDQQNCNNAWEANDSICAFRYIVEDDKNGITNWAYEISVPFENDWNLTKNADNNKDGWDDEQRYETWLINWASAAMDTTMHTKTATTTDISWVTTNTDKDLVISGGGVYVKD